MTNDVVLSAALRNNLLSLQDTQNKIDTHQGRLATGKKVNSALDNPQAFFAAQSLTNAASDLSNLLDSVGQSIQVINAANNGVTALTSLINQAQSLANTALSTLAGSSTTASQTGTINLGTGKLTGIPGIVSSDQIRISITDPTNANGNFDLGAGGTGDHGTNAVANNIVTIGANGTAADLVNSINDLNTGLTIKVVSASLNSAGQITITAVNGGDLNVAFGDSANGNFAPSNAAQDAAVQGFANALGFTNAKLNQNGAANVDSVDFTQLQASTVSSKALYSVGPTTVANASTLLTALKDSSNNSLTSLAAADTYTISVAGQTSANLLTFGGATVATATIQTLIDGVNHDTNIDGLVSASFNATTGQIVFNALTASATDVQTQLNSSTAAAGHQLNLGFGTYTGAQAQTGAAINDKVTENTFFGAAAGTLASLQTQYNTTLSQISALVTDTGYAGTNLLNGNDLVTYFNANRTSSLTTSGTTFTAGGLSLTNANFSNSAAINNSITQTTNALTTVRNFGSTLATNLSIIQNRQTFITSQINTLTTGSSALVNADQNQEGADLLALQTRQSLGITSLSLASQAQQSILKLF